MQEIFEAAKVTLSLAFLLYASWSDYKTREVTNRVWIAYAPIALALSLAELLLYDSARLPLFGLSVGVTIAIAFALFYSGGFGGADSKALMCIAMALPFFPATLLTPILASGVSPLAQTIFPLTIFSNAVLVAAFSGVALLLYNLLQRVKTKKKMFEDTLANESAWKKLVVLITGYKMPIAQLQAKWHIYPMEDIAEADGANAVKRKLVLVPRDEGRDAVVARLSEAVDTGKIGGKVWATPGLPMLIFVTIGLVIALFLGDVVWLLVSSLFGTL
jgi:preflagellin peptidase FlaK